MILSYFYKGVIRNGYSDMALRLGGFRYLHSNYDVNSSQTEYHSQTSRGLRYDKGMSADLGTC